LKLKSIASAIAAAALLVAVTACSDFTVDNAGGKGTCNGSPVSLAATRDANGGVLTIKYSGPATASLLMIQGTYSDDKFAGHNNQRVSAKDTQASNHTDAILIDRSTPQWSTSGSTETFNGTYEQLDSSASTDQIIPELLGVRCQTTGDTFVSGTQLISNDVTFTAAVQLNQNVLTGSLFQIASQAPTLAGDGVEGTLVYSADTANIYGDFSPTEFDGVTTGIDDPGVANSTPEEYWHQLWYTPNYLNGSIAFPANPGDPMPFNFNTGASGPIPDGDYLTRVAMSECQPGCDVPQTKVIFLNLHYSAVNGLSITAPDFALTSGSAPAVKHKKTLANTGSSETQAPLGVALAALGAIVVAAARRKKSNA
jgi:LPXTG-motif cell wall-anchored protein